MPGKRPQLLQLDQTPSIISRALLEGVRGAKRMEAICSEFSRGVWKEQKHLTPTRRSCCMCPHRAFYARDPNGLPNCLVNNSSASEMAWFDHSMPR